VGAFLASTAASRSTASVVGGRCALAHKRGPTERFAWPYIVIEKAAAARYRNQLLISPSKRSVVGVVEEMVLAEAVTFMVLSLVLDEFRRLGWIYPLRLLRSNRSLGPLRATIRPTSESVNLVVERRDVGRQE